MNQPIPRSFFRDGQRVIHRGEDGVIKITPSGEIWCSYINGCNDFFLMTTIDLLYDVNDLTLLDRTIDQVMEGDVVTRELPTEDSDTTTQTTKVLARCGDVVAVEEVINNSECMVVWIPVEVLSAKGYSINTQASPVEPPMTAERAKELRMESMNNYNKSFLPQINQRYCFWNADLKDGGGIVDCHYWTNDSTDLCLWSTGNFFPDTAEGRTQAEAWRDKYLPAFLFELQN